MRWDRRLKILFVVEILWGFVFMLSLGDIMVCCYDSRKASVFEEFSPGRHPLRLLWMAEEENIILIMYLG